jgi:isopropylmalate/homocitrate/citramalate synthase
MSRPQVSIYDTTLRDGTQGEGVSFSAEDKLRIARRLDEFGVDYIEGGWPGSNPKDMEFFHRAHKELKLRRARIAAFGSTCKAEAGRHHLWQDVGSACHRGVAHLAGRESAHDPRLGALSGQP